MKPTSKLGLGVLTLTLCAGTAWAAGAAFAMRMAKAITALRSALPGKLRRPPGPSAST